ncbi:hypothetical protein UVI_02058970 [Ustilaginoidea virens]|uniref:3-hydroxyisobutyrate dehydrogenase protein n=1 Tax=Ustilaginoidea virens TaxID=1159556 RepID=A0A1B5L651_USTVR|nr:hypothetical protein UVI_02058970 [Ustilaginoidea virens]
MSQRNWHGGAYRPATSVPANAHAHAQAHGGGYQPGVSAPRPQQPTPAPLPHGGGYQPGVSPHRRERDMPRQQARSAHQPSGEKDQHHTQGNLPHGGHPQQHDVPRPQGPQNPTAAARGAEQAWQQPQQPNWIPNPAQQQPSPQPRTYQRGYANLSDPRARLRWEFPNSYQKPGLSFVSTDKRRHRDILQRVWQGPPNDKYLSPCDGRLKNLVVQAAQDVYSGAQNSTWRRTFVRNVSPIYIQLANFPFSSVSTDPGAWTGEDWAMVGLKWIPTCLGLLCVVRLLWQPTAAEGQLRNNGWYDPFNYRYWGYPKVARNYYESPAAVDVIPHGGSASNLMIQRVLGPRYLCFLNEPSEKQMRGVAVRRVDQSTASTPYLFIAYTAEQFEEQDFEDLHHIAERAAREAGVPAYWVGCSCMQDKEEIEDDVYRISDVVRGAHSLVIAVGPSRSRPDWSSPDAMLLMWGERMWTLPEALLSPADKDVTICTRGGGSDPRVISRKQLAAVVWDDPLVSRQLIDHFNKTLDLSRLELVSIALGCLRGRKTTEYLPGDLSYALMGLLRLRPQIDESDSAFQAFARLSLANDSDMLLERLICMLPKDRDASSWLAMDDAWNAHLWDIYPACQVAGVGHDNTVILDGAFGAAIRWKAFATVKAIGVDSWRRLGSRMLIHGAPLVFLLGVILVATGASVLVGALLLILSLLIIVPSPYLVRVIYSGKIWGSQAWFFGFEGYLDLATIESHIFGAYLGRLKWSPASSSISKHMMNEHGECVGVDPTADAGVRAMVEQARHGAHGDLKVFTLVDTYTLTVTMFLAARPPVAVLICGREGGMQRALMCSYDWASQTLYRETVLRMETPVLERMFRVNRFRFGLQRPLPDVQ